MNTRQSPQSALALAKSGLRFVDPRTEAHFLAVRLDSQRWFVRAAVLGSMVIWILGGWLIPGQVDDSPQYATLIRVVNLGFFAPMALLGAVTLSRDELPSWLTPTAMIGNGLAGLWLVQLGIFAPDVFTNGIVVGFTVMCMFSGGGLYGLRLVPAAITLLPYTIALQAVLLLFPQDSSTAHLVLYSLIAWMAFLVALTGADGLEVAGRDAYVKDRIIEMERQRADDLLANMLPSSIASRLKSGETAIADECSEVTILFADLVGFTVLSGSMTAPDLVALLNEVFSEFDALATRHGVEKIKTIGDAYMLVAGIPLPRKDHVDAVAAMALEMHAALQTVNASRGTSLDLRIGMHTGAAVAGVIGQSKFAYDLWGDAVNVAARMESHGEPGRIQMSQQSRERLGVRFDVERRGEIEVKGKGVMETYWLVGQRG